jgi:CBS domain-containing protein/heme-degrading monooxygenase HmoA
VNAWITARRIKSGNEETFQKKWAGGAAPEGMLDAYLLQDEADPRNSLSISLWDSAEKLFKYRTSDDARRRDDELDQVIDKEQWSRGFVGFRASDLASGGGMKMWLMLPMMALAGATAAFLLVRRLRGSDMDIPEEPDTWQRESTTAMSTPSTMPPATAPTTPQYETQQAQVRPRVAGNASAPAPRTVGGGPPGAVRPAADTTGQSEASAIAGRRPNLLVRDLMTPNPVTVEHDADVTTAATRMRELNVGALPVTADGKLTGMVTDRDITLSLTDAKVPPEQIKVRDVMTDIPTAVSPHVSIEEASKLMADHQVRRLPVVEGTRIVGIIALGDLAADGAPQAAEDALEEISEPAKPQR